MKKRAFFLKFKKLNINILISYQHKRSKKDALRLANIEKAYIFATLLKGATDRKDSKTKRSDSVAQLVEHITFNDGVLGPSPSGIT